MARCRTRLESDLRAGADWIAPVRSRIMNNVVTFAWFGSVCHHRRKVGRGTGPEPAFPAAMGRLRLVLPPVALAALYVRLLDQRKALELPGSRWT